MQKLKIKIYLAGISLLMAFVMLVTASLAWFTISTAPEISGIRVGIYGSRTLLLSSDNTEYVQYLDLSPKFVNLAPLHPVSTVDGLNWFIPTYDSYTGELKDPKDFILDDSLEYANVFIPPIVSDEDDGETDIVDDLGDGETDIVDDLGDGGIDIVDDLEHKGYYVYADFWMMTEEDGCNVRITIPHYDEFDTNEGSDFMTAFGRNKDAAEEVAQGWYGSYVLNSGFKLSEEGEVILESREAETSMRVGFLLNPSMLDPNNADDISNADAITAINETREEDEEPLDPTQYDGVQNNFYIYEPNADIRSADNKPLGTENKSEVDYVLGYQFNLENYADGKYFVTQPIAKKEYTRPKTDPETGEILIDPETGETLTETYFGGKVADITSYAKTYLIIQKASQWNMDKVEAKLSGEDGEILNSNDVQYPMGGFLNTTNVYGALDNDTDGENINNTGRIAAVDDMSTDIAGSSIIVTLKKDTPIKVRLFIWIEGQDVDCWNDIAAGKFVVNLELAGETVSASSDDPGGGTSGEAPSTE